MWQGNSHAHVQGGVRVHERGEIMHKGATQAVLACLFSPLRYHTEALLLSFLGRAINSYSRQVGRQATSGAYAGNTL